ELGARGLTSVFCEGGSALTASLLTADLVDELICFNAGFAIGAEGLPAVGALGLDRLDAAQRFTLATATPIGGDVMQSWQRAEQS
ncbi:MAG: dihydrofolate reductase family protein, partial [Pseudomonadota bacterium]